VSADGGTSTLEATAALAERTAEDLSLVELELVRLLEGNKQMSRRLSKLDEKLSSFVIECRRATDEIEQTLTLQGALLERILGNLRGPL
jgi:cell division septum initiation protein DivIVA